MSNRHYVFSGPETTRVLDTAGGRVEARTPPANEPTYALFVRDTLRRFRAGEAPLTGLADMVDVMAAVDRAYDLAWPLVAQTRNTVLSSP